MRGGLTPFERRHWWRSWRWSAVLHVCLAMLLVVEALWLPLPFLAGPAAAQPLIVVEQQAADPAPLEVEMPLDERPWMARDAEDPTYAQVDLTDPRWSGILSEPLRRAEGAEESAADDDASVLISAELMRAIEASGRRSEDENLRSLSELSQRLARVSSETTIDELSGTIGRLVGTEARQARPKEDVAGAFDHASGQPHDCKKLESPEGQVRYVMVMIDKEGRTMEIEMDDANGEQVYQTMQLIKSNPLLDRLYRGIVMGIIDKLLAPK